MCDRRHNSLAAQANQIQYRRIKEGMVAVMKSAGAPTQADFHEAISNRSDRWFAACLHITRNHALAEDAVQDALLNAWNKRDQFDHGARLETWIHRIAVNAALQLLRKQRPGIFEPFDMDIEDDGVTPESAKSAEELGEGFAAAAAGLSEIERVCFVLKHLEQWRLQEIAEELNIKVNAVKQALFRGVKKLRESMVDLRSEHYA
jgi:RNA polymerase sigma-70 factor (ECF subfamily)